MKKRKRSYKRTVKDVACSFTCYWWRQVSDLSIDSWFMSYPYKRYILLTQLQNYCNAFAVSYIPVLYQLLPDRKQQVTAYLLQLAKDKLRHG